MIDVEKLSKQEYQQVLAIFWRWFPKGVLNGKKTINEKTEFALELEREYRSLRNENEFMTFIYKLAALQRDGDRI